MYALFVCLDGQSPQAMSKAIFDDKAKDYNDPTTNLKAKQVMCITTLIMNYIGSCCPSNEDHSTSACRQNNKKSRKDNQSHHPQQQYSGCQSK